MTRDESDAQLRQAILDHAAAYELSKDDELLNEYAIVCNWQRLEADGKSRYTTHFHSPEVPQHVAVGLFRLAEQFQLNDEEDE